MFYKGQNIHLPCHLCPIFTCPSHELTKLKSMSLKPPWSPCIRFTRTLQNYPWISLHQSSSSPPRPPSLPTTCCMSGCANCVWLDYADEVVDFYCKRMGQGGVGGAEVDQILKESSTGPIGYSDTGYSYSFFYPIKDLKQASPLTVTPVTVTFLLQCQFFGPKKDLLILKIQVTVTSRLQWQTAYSDTSWPSQHCHCKRGGLYWKSESQSLTLTFFGFPALSL